MAERGKRPDRDRAGWPQTLGLTLLSVLVAAALSLTPQWQRLELLSFDLNSTLFPKQPPVLSAVVVAIDEPSFAEYGQWPWRRDIHARLIETLRAAGAKAIVLDLVFAEPSAFPDADAALAHAMAPDVVLAADIYKIEDPNVSGVREILPLPGLTDAGARHGFVKIAQPDPDEIVRRMPQQPDSLATVALQAASTETITPPAADALIQYFGPRGTYPTISYYRALNWQSALNTNLFKDKIVVVGFGQDSPAAVSARTADAFATSFTSRGAGATFGAEIHATILDNLRYGLWIAPMPLSIAALLAIAICLATGFVLRNFGLVRSAAWTIVGLAAILILAFALLRFGRVWLPPVTPVTALVLMSVGRTAIGYLEERTRRQRVVTMFGHYLAPAMVERLQNNPELLKLGGEVRELTILFCDVRGFTTISERMQADPERLTQLVNRILTALSNCVLAEKGTIDKYIGDCIMAFWNAPLDEPEHALRGARAALGMLDAIALLNRDLAAEGLPSIAIGVGLNTGRCVVGNMGSDKQFDYSALGDSVNLASRLESASKELGVSIVIGPETARQIGERLPLLALDTIHVKGKEELIAPCTVVAELASRRDDLDVLREIHRQLVNPGQSFSAETRDALIQRAESIAPSLGKYYAHLQRLA